MKTIGLCLLLPILGFASLRAMGQSVPTGGVEQPLGFQVPTLGGSLNYSVSVSESISKGFYDGSQVGASTNLSGNVAFITASQRHPFSLVYSGGYLISNANQPSAFYQNLAFSQVLTAGRWNFLLSDGVSYLPQTGTAGLSGIPGVGDVGVAPVQVVDTPGLGILTYFGPRVSNTAAVSASHPITPSLSFQASGTYSTLRFLGDTTSSSAVGGLDSNTEGGSAGLNYRIDARNNVGGNYNISHFGFSGGGSTFTTQGATAFYSRQWTRRLATNVYAGPQRSSSSAFSNPAISLAAGAGLTYAGKVLTTGLSYSRGVNNGSGVIAGAVSDSLTANVRRVFGRAWGVSGSLGYARTKSIPTLMTTLFSSEGVFATGQVSRAIGRHFSAFGAYGVQEQSLSNTSTTLVNNAFNGVYQTFSFGLTYSPSSINLGRR